MRILAALIAIVVGLIVLLGYFLPIGLLLELRQVLVESAVVLAGVAVLVGVISLTGVHWKKIRAGQKNSAYSLLLIFSLVAAFMLGVIGTNNPFINLVFNGVIVPAEASLMALLAVTLIYASARLLRRRADVMTFIFLGIAIVTLLISAPLPVGNFPLGDEIRYFINEFFAVPGARGILIGVALGALTTGLRVLMGADRPYGGK